MSRKQKYSKELKLEIINRYLSGESASMLANEYGMPASGNSKILEWAEQYQGMDTDDIFEAKERNTSYSKELKMLAIKDYLDGNGSYRTIANKYKIRSNSILIKWVSNYNSHIEIKDYDPKPEVYMAKSRKVLYEEKIAIVKYCIDHDLDYKNTASLYDTTYTQVFNWVKKYQEGGEQSLLDNRGKRKIEGSLTDMEKLQKENERLKRELEYEKIKVEALKKLKEIEMRDARNKKQNIKR